MCTQKKVSPLQWWPIIRIIVSKREILLLLCEIIDMNFMKLALTSKNSNYLNINKTNLFSIWWNICILFFLFCILFIQKFYKIINMLSIILITIYHIFHSIHVDHGWLNDIKMRNKIELKFSYYNYIKKYYYYCNVISKNHYFFWIILHYFATFFIRFSYFSLKDEKILI